MIYITYEDEGPKSISCQACSITNFWKKLFKIDADDVSKVMLDDWLVYMNKSRKNACITYIYYDNGDTNDVGVLNLK